MKKIIPFLFVLFSGFISSQDLKSIKKTVAEINQTKNYKIKIVPYSYFMDKSQVTDNGIELKGFYKDGVLKKIEHFVGLSACEIITQYFFSKEDKLIFVLAKKYQIVDENGYMKDPKQISESRYYYIDEKLGKVFKTPNNNDEEIDYLKEIQALKKDLKEYK